MSCPCKGCTKRWVSKTSRCHSSCTEYKDWSETAKRQREAFQKKRYTTDSVGKVLFGRRRKR